MSGISGCCCLTKALILGYAPWDFVYSGVNHVDLDTSEPIQQDKDVDSEDVNVFEKEEVFINEFMDSSSV
eukprot:16447222-Heterocapsa_arctica.AAC.1